jgi:hypothetical protein
MLGVSIAIILNDLKLSKYWSNICHPTEQPYRGCVPLPQAALSREAVMIRIVVLVRQSRWSLVEHQRGYFTLFTQTHTL